MSLITKTAGGLGTPASFGQKKGLLRSMVKNKKPSMMGMKSSIKGILNKPAKNGASAVPMKLDGGLGANPLQPSQIGSGNGSNLGTNGIF